MACGLPGDPELHLCPAGHYCDGLEGGHRRGGPQECPAYTYRATPGAGARSHCHPCPPGSYCNTTGLICTQYTQQHHKNAFRFVYCLWKSTRITLVITLLKGPLLPTGASVMLPDPPDGFLTLNHLGSRPWKLFGKGPALSEILT